MRVNAAFAYAACCRAVAARVTGWVPLRGGVAAVGVCVLADTGAVGADVLAGVECMAGVSR